MATMRPPAGLGKAGASIWRSVTARYELREDELLTLEDACRTSDMLSALESAWADDGSPMTTKGSMGQLVIHPLIGEIRAQRAARNALWRQLKLPDDGAVAPPNQAREAAQASWKPAARRRGA